MFYQEEPEFEQSDDEFEAQDQESGERIILGMSPIELGIFAVLLIMIVVLGWSFLSRVLGGSASGNQVTGSALDLSLASTPTDTPVPSPTPIPTSTPMPGWSRFEFNAGQAEIWLPVSFQGGDTVAFEDIVLLTMDVYLEDADKGQLLPIVTSDDVLFFAFDAESPDAIRFLYILAAQVPAEEAYPITAFLEEMSDAALSTGARILSRNRLDLDYYADTAYIVLEEALDNDAEVETGADISPLYVNLATYGILVDDTLWNLSFRTTRDDFSSFRSTMDNAAMTFYVHP